MCSTIASDVTIITFFFFNDTATTEIYTLSLHDALPIYPILVQLLRQLVLVRFESPGSGRAGSGSGSLGNRARSASANGPRFGTVHGTLVQPFEIPGEGYLQDRIQPVHDLYGRPE